MRNLSGEGVLEIGAREALRVREDLLLDANQHGRARVVRAEPHGAVHREAGDDEDDEQHKRIEELARLGGRVVHCEYGVGQAFGGIGNRGEHRAAEHREDKEPQTAPEELSEEVQRERQ